MFIIAQLDPETSKVRGCSHGPFNKEAEALAYPGFDENSRIVDIVPGCADFTSHQWNAEWGKWDRLATAMRERSGKALALHELTEEYYAIAEQLPLSDTLVGWSGSLTPRVMVVGDHPEDCDGDSLYSGEQGEILKSALLDANLTQNEVYLTTLVKHTLFSDREKLTHDEMSLFVPLLLKEIRIVEPATVVLLGLATAKAVLGKGKLTNKEALATVYTIANIPGVELYVGYHPKFVNHAGGRECYAYRSYVRQFQAAKKRRL